MRLSIRKTARAGLVETLLSSTCQLHTFARHTAIEIAPFEGSDAPMKFGKKRKLSSKFHDDPTPASSPAVIADLLRGDAPSTNGDLNSHDETSDVYALVAKSMP